MSSAACEFNRQMVADMNKMLTAKSSKALKIFANWLEGLMKTHRERERGRWDWVVNVKYGP